MALTSGGGDAQHRFPGSGGLALGAEEIATSLVPDLVVAGAAYQSFSVAAKSSGKHTNMDRRQLQGVESSASVTFSVLRRLPLVQVRGMQLIVCFRLYVRAYDVTSSKGL